MENQNGTDAATIEQDAVNVLSLRTKQVDLATIHAFVRKGDEFLARLKFKDGHSSEVDSDEIGDILLINVAREQIVRRKPHEEYVALSYVWGDSKNEFLRLNASNFESLSTPGGLNSQVKSIPKTVQDAIHFARALGWRYLWVDSLCIIHDSPAEVQREISRMGEIYRNSKLTIVAASRNTNRSGLPSWVPDWSLDTDSLVVSKPFDGQLTELFEECTPRRKMSWDANSRDLLINKWCKRAWTFQETLLSRKTLIFTEDQLHFVWGCSPKIESGGIWQSLGSEIKSHHGPYLAVDILSRDIRRSNDPLGTLKVTPDISTVSEDPSEDKSLFSTFETASSSPITVLEDITKLAIDHFVRFLLQRKELVALFTEAVSIERVGPYRLERKLTRLLHHYGLDLGKEALGQQQKGAADLIRNQAEYAAREIRNKFNAISRDDELHQKLQRQPQNQNELREERLERYLRQLRACEGFGEDVPSHGSNLSSESDESEDSDSDPRSAPRISIKELETVESFLTSSEAFEIFLGSLWDFVDPTFVSITRSLANQFYDPVDCYELNGHQNEMDGFLAKIQQIPPHLVKVSYVCILSSQDMVKNYIERITMKSWDWWPLAACVERIPTGHARVNWTCGCGDEQWSDIPVELAKHLEWILGRFSLADKTHTSTHKTKTTDERPRHEETAPGSSLGLNWSPDTPCDKNSSDTGAQGPGTIPVSNAELGTFRGNSAYIAILGVRSGNNLRLAQIDVKAMKDDHLFEAIKNNYQKIRGYLRQYFSIWRFAHCDFVKFEKFGEGDFAKISNEMPPPENEHYQYRPKPVRDMPPISQHEFWKRFYFGQQCRLFCRLTRRFHKCKKTCRPCYDAVDRVPKKIWPLEEGGDAREYFWGMLAVEKVSFPVVVCYHSIFLIGPFAFWFLWIFHWNHHGDLQNASVPLVAVLGLLSLFWFPLIHN